MKYRALWLAAPVALLGFGSCEKKPTETAAGTPAVVEAPAGETPAAPTPPAAPAPPAVEAVKVLSAEERAAKLGFVKYLPQDTEAVIGFYDGKKSAQRAGDLKLWKLVEEQVGGLFGMGMGGDPGFEMEEGMEMESELEDEDTTEPIEPDSEQEDADPEDGADAPEMAEEDEDLDDMEMEMLEPLDPADLLGNEFTVALGKSAGEQTANLVTLNNRYNYFMMRGLAKAFVTAAKTGDASEVEEMIGGDEMEDVFMNLLKDPESGTALLERAHMPPLYFAFRVDEDKRESALQQIASSVEFLGMFEEQVEPLDFEQAGGTFAGYRLIGAKISEAMADSRDEMVEDLGEESTDALLAAIAKKDLVVVAGILGEYVVLFIGSSKDDFKLVDSTADSLAANDSLAFADAYASKDIAALIHGGKPALDALQSSAGGLSDMARGLRDGLGESEGLGDTRDLEAMLEIVAERENALMALTSHEAYGLVAFFDEGLRIESVGGFDSGALDYTTPPKLAGLGEGSDTVFFANLTSEAAFDEKSRAYYEAIIETIYAMALKISQVEMEVEEMEQFKGMFAMFDEKFRGDMVAMWDAYSQDFSAGVGQESALVMDLKGGLPAIPGLPQEVVDNGKFLRASLVMPVTDRAKIQEAWKIMNTSVTNLLAQVSEMAGEDIPMQKPISSEKDGFVTWFFALPFTSDDFMPSVTVSDEWFVASTSKTHALELAAKAGSPSAAPRLGMWMDMSFVALQQYAKEMLAMVDENAAAIFGEEGFALDQFQGQKEMIGKVIGTLDDLDRITVHARREGGALRTSLHFKTR